jgi:hypothetical protein
MKQAVAAVTIFLGAAAVFAQEPAVERSTIWVDAVKRGDMPVMVRGRGVLTANMTAELNIPESQSQHVQLGQAVSVDTRQGIVNGKVMRIDASVLNGMRIVEASAVALLQ